MNRQPPFRAIPSIDEVLRSDAGSEVAARHGRTAATAALRAAADRLRASLRAEDTPTDRSAIIRMMADEAAWRLADARAPRLRRVFNLTGTVLHTNLGRAALAEAAITAATDAMRHAVALEANVETGRRGERDDAVRDRLRDLTGAEDALVVNNNAAAVLLVLNALAAGRETVVSRGELIEIGGAFRMPDVMASAGTRLVEVGTTNRTHPRDYETAIGPETGLLMKVHTSNYVIQGFTAEVSPADLAGIGHARGVPVVDDLGSGTLVDLSAHGLKRERTVREAVADGADIVTFSGDKLLGGPQAGIVVGRADLIARCARNPLKRALRLDKIRLAALEATLVLYQDPDQLAVSLPTLAMLTRPVSALEAVSREVATAVGSVLGPGWTVETVACESQIGSGALPLETLPSRGIAIGHESGGGSRPEALAKAFRSLPIPVFGHVREGKLYFDCRCLFDSDDFNSQLSSLETP